MDPRCFCCLDLPRFLAAGRLGMEEPEKGGNCFFLDPNRLSTAILCFERDIAQVLDLGDYLWNVELERQVVEVYPSITIQSCTCSKGFASSLEILKGQSFCKGCGGVVSVHKAAALSRRMLSAMKPEFSRVIDPYLTWKTSSNGKRRAFRRARTFTQENRNKFLFNCLKDSEIIDEDSRKKWDMSVSESEKLGVSILGRRFGGAIESVPIKKRRFEFLPCQSPPQRSSSDHSLESCPDLFSDTTVKQDELGGVYCGQVGTCAELQSGLEDVDKQLSDSADFSGISILAAAAASESSIERGFADAKDSTVIQHPQSQKFEESHQSHEPEYEINKGKPQMESSVTVDVMCCECNETKSDECKMVSPFSLQKFSHMRGSMPSSDDRLLWDLNKVMDVWECQPDDFSTPERHPAAILNKDGSHACISGMSEPGRNITSIGVGGFVRVNAEDQDFSSSFIMSDVVERKYNNPTNDEKNVGFSQNLACGSLRGEFLYKAAKDKVETGAEKTKSAQSGQERFLVTGDPSDSSAGNAELVRDLSLKAINVFNEGKAETSSMSLNIHMKTRNTSHQVITENASICRATDAGYLLAEDENITDSVHDKGLLAKAINVYDHSVDGQHVDDGRASGNAKLISHIEPRQSSCNDVAVDGIASCSPASDFDQDAQERILHSSNSKNSHVLIDGSNSKNLTCRSCLSDETANTDSLENAYANAHLSKSLSFDSQLTSDLEQLLSISTCNSKYEKNSEDMRIGESKCCLISDESLNSKKAAAFVCKHTNIDSAVEGCSDAPQVDVALSSQEVYRTSVGGCVSSENHVSLDEHLDSEYRSDASPNGTCNASGMEKVDFLRDDDSQYEDGELRESVLNSWMEDGVEDVETEHVDYGSDTKETDWFETDHDFQSGLDFTAEGMECKNEENEYVAEDHSQLKTFHKCINSQDVLNVGYGNIDVGLGLLKLAKETVDANDANKAPSKFENRLLPPVAPDNSGFSGKLAQPARTRMKPSGWDKLPGSKDTALNSGWNHDHASLDPYPSSQNAGGYARPILHRDLSARLERLKSSETSRTKDVSYARASGKTDQNLNAERNSETYRSIGRSRPYFLSHVRDIDDHQGEPMCSPDNVGNHYNASGFYSSSSFSHPGSRNAAAAAVAKVESNGFIVAPDGTIVKAGSSGPTPHACRHSQNSSAHVTHSSGRGPPLERDGSFSLSAGLCNQREASEDRYYNVGPVRATRYGSGMVSIGYRSFHGSVSEDRVDLPPQQNPFSRSERSFSPQRRRLSCDQKLSPSRSRTRSPHTWATPHGRNDGRMSAVPNARRQSRSPRNFSSDISLERHRSPHQPSIPGEDLASYGPMSRSHTSPSHTARWIGGKRNMPDHLLERQHRRPIGRSAAGLSRSQRLDEIDTHGRLKQKKFNGSMHSGRFQDFVGYGRGRKRDDQDDARTGGSNTYKMLHPEKHHGNNGSMKRFPYDDEYYRSHNRQPKSSALQWRESPRIFERNIDYQHVHSPQRMNEGRSHFRYDRDGKPDSDMKSFGVRGNNDDISLQRRSS
ncbi:hypothetical protein AXF42_Ash008483 [Apostasia shenzhenica]|uniref:Uncharacterized protein n=1 Tax=Apostasia shenzhenica TaxID=1088818 RepID=A0A2I0AXZ8_9ASPA|nr:hypothetical protein AXF42_Ash008483 [Apostasia shenzhenica]